MLFLVNILSKWGKHMEHRPSRAARFSVSAFRKVPPHSEHLVPHALGAQWRPPAHSFPLGLVPGRFRLDTDAGEEERKRASGQTGFKQEKPPREGFKCFLEL